jgi:membrane protein implicated in regulation of membrane protease activity
MIKRGCSYRIVLRYTLFQLPGLIVLVLFLILLRSWINIPLWSEYSIVVLWVAKDVIMFPFVWRAYDKYSADSLAGSRGKAIEPISPIGYIMVKGELWKAEVVDGSPSVNSGDNVIVISARGLTLLVQPEEKQ